MIAPGIHEQFAASGFPPSGISLKLISCWEKNITHEIHNILMSPPLFGLGCPAEKRAMH